MSDAYIGEIRLFPMNWAPAGWRVCDGSQMPISSNQVLYTLLGQQFGGDGKTTFNLPDLRGRTPVGLGINPQDPDKVPYAQGNSGGVEAVALTLAQIPPHTHALACTSDPGTIAAPTASYFAQTPANHNLYGTPTASAAVALTSATIGSTGNGAAHPNMQPSLVLNYCICVNGVYPSRP